MVVLLIVAVEDHAVTLASSARITGVLLVVLHSALLVAQDAADSIKFAETECAPVAHQIPSCALEDAAQWEPFALVEGACVQPSEDAVTLAAVQGNSVTQGATYV